MQNRNRFPPQAVGHVLDSSWGQRYRCPPLLPPQWPLRGRLGELPGRLIPLICRTPLMEKLQTPEDRAWYARATVQHGWSRNILVHQIESALHQRQGRAVTNFDRALPSPQSELAQQITDRLETFPCERTLKQ